MSFHMIRGGASGTTVINELGSEDPFEITFRPAKPVLDAVIEMLEPLRWLDQRRRSRLPLFEPERAAELIDLIPSGNRIAKAGALFLEAEEIPALEAWMHVAVGLMCKRKPTRTPLTVTPTAAQSPTVHSEIPRFGDSTIPDSRPR